MKAHSKLTWERFMRRVQAYMPPNARVWYSSEDGQRESPLSVDRLKANTFYHFNHHALSALSHVLEDMALDFGEGRWTAVFRDFSDYEESKEKYWQLAATLGEVLVLGWGQAPKRHGQLRFSKMANPQLSGLWAILYRGPLADAMLMCTSGSSSVDAEEQIFSGFLSLDERIVDQNLECLLHTARGKSGSLDSFERLKKMDGIRKGIHGLYVKEALVLDRALSKLELEGGNPNQILESLNRSIKRLQRMQSDIAEDLNPGGLTVASSPL